MHGGLTEFDGSIHAQQDVVALDVAVDDLVKVEELQRLQTLWRQTNRQTDRQTDRDIEG